jgi:acyl homoserine lactone synthase
MIETFSLSSAYLYQDAWASQARLRYKIFVKQRGLPHTHFDGLEYDEFDTPSAVYLVWRDEDRHVRGLVRLLRTDRPYMLKSYWPHLVANGELPESERVWEITRVCVDKDVAPATRKVILPSLLAAVDEFFVGCGAVGMIGVTLPHLLSYFIREGVQWLGTPATIEGRLERAFFVPSQHVRPHHHCHRYRIPRPVLSWPSDHAKDAA